MKQWFVSLAVPLLVLVGLVCVPGSVWAAEIEDARIWPAPDNTRLVFDLSGPVEHRVFVLSNPTRVVVDISDVSLGTDLARLSLDNSGVSRIRSAQRDGGELRVVLDLSTQLSPRSFALRPNEQYGHRLVLDLERPPGLSMEPSERQV
ncbi:MAG: AMIN domain-containing protein, partial [Saccharospirillum sp.]